MVSEAGGAGKLLLREIALPYSSLPNLRPDLPAPPEGRDANRVEKEENNLFFLYRALAFRGKCASTNKPESTKSVSTWAPSNGGNDHKTC